MKMKKVMKKIVAVAMASIMVIGAAGCGSNSKQETDTASDKEKAKAELSIAYQYGITYAPLAVMKDQNLIEKYYEGDVAIDWQVLNSGAAINEGVIAGDIDVAAMGIAPFITGVTAGVPYKLYSAMSSGVQKLTTNKSEILSLKDIKQDDKISVVNIGSIQHILLAMECEKQLGDAHALDNNLVAMAHPDGMNALLAESVQCHITGAPYIYEEEASENISVVSDFTDVWAQGNTFIVGLVSTKLHDENPALYQAICDATSEAMDFINEHQDETAELLAELNEVSKEDMLSWLQDPMNGYTMEVSGVMDMAEFMERAGFIEKAPDSLEAISYENVSGN